MSLMGEPLSLFGVDADWGMNEGGSGVEQDETDGVRPGYGGGFCFPFDDVYGGGGGRVRNEAVAAVFRIGARGGSAAM